jgi:hypothetical protein
VRLRLFVADDGTPLEAMTTQLATSAAIEARATMMRENTDE